MVYRLFSYSTLVSEIGEASYSNMFYDKGIAFRHKTKYMQTVFGIDSSTEVDRHTE